MSVRNPKKYCDFVGFHANYQDPKSGLRYYGTDQFELIQHLPDDVRDNFLSVRKAQIVLK